MPLFFYSTGAVEFLFNWDRYEISYWGLPRLPREIHVNEERSEFHRGRSGRSYWGGISAVRRKPLRSALVRSVCMLHADRLRLAHLSERISGHSVWARACPGATLLEYTVVVTVFRK